MLLTLTTTAEPATDLGYLLHKHPDRAQTFPVAAGSAHVFYPRAEPEVCTAALLLEVDPVALVRGRSDAFALGQYVNDRPYAAGSMLAVALGAVFSSAMKGRCTARPKLPSRAIPLTVHVPTLPCHGGAELVERLFAPLGWRVEAAPVPLDPQIPEWGDSRYLDTTLTGELRLADALTHLYVLLPVLDGAKHYWVDAAEVDKLLRAGGEWLAAHPERELITRRYLAHRGAYVRTALERLAEADDTEVEALDNALEAPVVQPDDPEKLVPLALQRRGSVIAVLRAAGARRVLDLGCGGGALLRDLLADPRFTEILGVDVSAGALEAAARRLRLDRLPERQRERIALRQSALTYADASLAGYDAAVLMEVIEHVDEVRLPALEHAVLGVARPGTVVVTTPNVEYNVRFETLEPGRFRHTDHRFEWTRAQFREWAAAAASRHGYRVRFLPVGPDDPEVGPPTQLAVFEREVVS
ncbi:3' terminal RNA ribose 2'-O-methyltransferase Hen1 [Pseudonocardia sp. DSM 110487]|uniref:3' terminal RNA ribose 2'-O-methyltransferase Hen1 n=1 Tax=Pseudonocardia sp. DSM 110487 TaxID=2865833 RepID=UPI001C69EEBF|nr:3' terminal RNA ribose 2'-O-methyltransferase Hen1 [Pseudonocardia sp. DSM 110487]QYN37970.1 3' terminal RNA ribose 2'-O-methyltransferase Hen1 [Pseudonocardia sp. DSM 110487]